MKKIIVLFGCLVLFPFFCFSEDIYISQAAQGADSGTGCSNSHSAAWFNTAANWANPKQAGKIGPGDTAHLCGTIVIALDIKGSGSSEKPIADADSNIAGSDSNAFYSDGDLNFLG